MPAAWTQPGSGCTTIHCRQDESRLRQLFAHLAHRGPVLVAVDQHAPPQRRWPGP